MQQVCLMFSSSAGVRRRNLRMLFMVLHSPGRAGHGSSTSESDGTGSTTSTGKQYMYSMWGHHTAAAVAHTVQVW